MCSFVWGTFCFAKALSSLRTSSAKFHDKADFFLELIEKARAHRLCGWVYLTAFPCLNCWVYNRRGNSTSFCSRSLNVCSWEGIMAKFSLISLVVPLCNRECTPLGSFKACHHLFSNLHLGKSSFLPFNPSRSIFINGCEQLVCPLYIYSALWQPEVRLQPYFLKDTHGSWVDIHVADVVGEDSHSTIFAL